MVSKENDYKSKCKRISQVNYRENLQALKFS